MTCSIASARSSAGRSGPTWFPSSPIVRIARSSAGSSNTISTARPSVTSSTCPGSSPRAMNDMADAQLRNGLVPNIAPEYTVFNGTFRAAAEWGSRLHPRAVAAIPVRRRPATCSAEYYPRMKRYFALPRKPRHERHRVRGPRRLVRPRPQASGPAPRNSPCRRSPPRRSIITTPGFSRRLAALLGQDRTTPRITRPAPNASAPVSTASFISADKGSYASDSQCANAMPLVMGIVEPTNREAVLASLVARRRIARLRHDGGRRRVSVTSCRRWRRAASPT